MPSPLEPLPCLVCQTVHFALCDVYICMYVFPETCLHQKNSSKNICKCEFDTRNSGKNTFPQFGITFAFDSDMTFAAYYRKKERERKKEIGNIISTEYLWNYRAHVFMHECKYSIYTADLHQITNPRSGLSVCVFIVLNNSFTVIIVKSSSSLHNSS